MGQKRNRRTREEMHAYYQEQIARLEAAMAGKVDTSTESGLLKALRKRLRKTNTELKAARVTLNGVAKEDGKGWVRSPIDEKIAQTEARLESQRETKARAEEMSARLPFDIQTLNEHIEAIEQGEDVDFPSNLTPLPGEEDRTDEEHEAAYIAKDGEED